MGQHKTNPTAVAAKDGKLKRKPKGPGKREVERDLQRMIYDRLFRPFLGSNWHNRDINNW